MVSSHVTPDTALLIDARSIAASAGTIALDASNQATIAFGESDKTSLWQKDLSALRCERWLAFDKLRDGAVAVIADVDWSPGSPA